MKYQAAVVALLIALSITASFWLGSQREFASCQKTSRIMYSMLTPAQQKQLEEDWYNEQDAMTDGNQ